MLQCKTVIYCFNIKRSILHKYTPVRTVVVICHCFWFFVPRLQYCNISFGITVVLVRCPYITETTINIYTFYKIISIALVVQPVIVFT